MADPERKPGHVGPPTFLERWHYRRRRIIDAIKLLPIIAAGLFLTPALILGGRGTEPGATATQLVYFFLCWAVLIAAGALLIRAHHAGDAAGDEDRG